MRAKTTKKEIVEDMRICTGCNGFISAAQIARYTGISRNNKDEVRKFIIGCRYEENGNGRKYLTTDVAQNIIDHASFEVAGS